MHASPQVTLGVLSATRSTQDRLKDPEPRSHNSPTARSHPCAFRFFFPAVPLRSSDDRTSIVCQVNVLHIRALVKADAVVLFDTYGSTDSRLHSVFLYHLEVRASLSGSPLMSLHY